MESLWIILSCLLLGFFWANCNCCPIGDGPFTGGDCLVCEGWDGGDSPNGFQLTIPPAVGGSWCLPPFNQPPHGCGNFVGTYVLRMASVDGATWINWRTFMEGLGYSYSCLYTRQAIQFCRLANGTPQFYSFCLAIKSGAPRITLMLFNGSFFPGAGFTRLWWWDQEPDDLTCQDEIGFQDLPWKIGSPPAIDTTFCEFTDMYAVPVQL